jgi:hypothetical protein
LLFTLGGVRVEFGSLKEDVQKKTASIDKVADDVQAIKVEQARQSADLSYLRQAELRRQSGGAHERTVTTGR